MNVKSFSFPIVLQKTCTFSETEFINDIYEAGLQNDKLPLLFMENSNAKVAVKTPNGISERMDIKNIIMQGPVWGSLMCTATMDKLGQKAYENKSLLYWYKGTVAVPPLCMVDDVLAVQECSQNSVQINSVINSFIELKKLKLSSDKCSKIHVGKVNSSCPDLKVHNMKMKNSNKEKYLGDYIDKSGKVKQTIEHRVAKGNGIVAEILAIVEEIPLGVYRLEMGLKLRQAMFINGVLFNSEAWHNVTNDDIKPLEKLDESLLRSLLQNHPKSPIEYLYLETGSVKIRHILASRRIMYLKTILGRDDEELIKRIFREQERNPSPGDFYELVKQDFDKYEITYNEEMIVSTKEEHYKGLVRNKIRETAFTELKMEQASHSKVRKIIYEKLEAQGYLKSPLFSNEDVAVLSNLRSHTTRTIRANFKNMYTNDKNCPLKCWAPDAVPLEDTQEHLLVCTKLNDTASHTIASEKIAYNDIYDSVHKQKAIVTIMKQLLDDRNGLLKNISTGGDSLDPSTLGCYASTTSHICKNNCSVCTGI